MTHYERLGVGPNASPEQLRDAYRRAARAHHPDAHGDRSAAQMAEINRAWSVLRDPAQRRQYDLTLSDVGGRAGPSSRQTSPPRTPARGGVPPRPAERAGSPLRIVHEPARFPWRFMGFMAAAGIAVVVLGVIIAKPPVVPPPDNLLYPGSCVVFQPNDDAVEVNCTDRHEAVVVELVAFGEACQYPTEPHRDRQGRGTACVRRL